MSVRIESQVEPIPGYKLLERLGSGGFGEVWKAEAPGGIFKAIKIIFGDLRSHDSDLLRYAEQELKALKRVKMVRHPYLLALDRYDIVDGRLMIVMELADCNLWDRFRDCRDQGLPGIPRDELMLYMIETAEVLDLMNDQHQLQHLDIKPQNLFMLHNHVKVADFGQVKDLQGVIASVTGGITPVYAAPETFDGIVSRFCDQYSLACVYQELLTGFRPFDGCSMSQLLMQHIQLPPDLKPSPACDRPVLLRALSKKAEDRWPSVTAFVKALREAGAPPSAGSREMPALGSGSSVVTRKAERPALDSAAYAQELGLSLDTPLPWSGADTESLAPITIAPPEVNGPGPLQPTLIIGLGQSGLRVVQRFRYDLTERYGAPSYTPLIRTLFLDSDSDTLDDAAVTRPQEKLAALRAEEILPAKLQRATHYLKPRLNGRNLLEGWFDTPLLYRLPRNPQTMGFRQLGRLAFCDHYRPFITKIQAELDAALAPESMQLTEQRTGLEARSNRPRIFVVAGLAGGTGGGMFLDVAYALRGRLQKMGYENPDITGVFLVPSADPTLASQQALGNCYASLLELNHYSRAETQFIASYDDRNPVVRDHHAPFTRCFLLPGTTAGLLTNRQTPVGSGIQRNPMSRTPTTIPHPGVRGRTPGSGTVAKPGSRAVPASATHRHPDPRTGSAAMKPYTDAADLIRYNVFSPVGRTLDSNRAEKMADAPNRSVSFSAFGLAGFDWPRAEVVARTTSRIARNVLKRWVAPNIKRAREVVPSWSANHWTQFGLDPDVIMNHLQAAAEMAVGGKIEELISLTTEPLIPKGWLARLPDPELVSVALDRLVKMFGPPSSSLKRSPTPVEAALAKATAEAAEGFELDLRSIGPALVEDPTFRVAGAEEVLRQLLATTDRLIDRYQLSAAEVDIRAQAGYECVAQYAHHQKGMKKPPTSGFGEAFRQFPRCRYQSLTYRHMNNLYQVVRDLLATQLADIAQCRTRMESSTRGDPAVDELEPISEARTLMPPGCGSLAEAVQRFLEVLSDADLDEIDRRVQVALEPEAGGLFNACMNATEGHSIVATTVWEETRAYLDTRLGEVDLGAMFAERFRSQALAEKAIEQAFHEAEPGWVGHGPWANSELVVLAAPPSSNASVLRDLAVRAVPVAGLPFVDSCDELRVYREYPAVPLSVLPHFGPAGAAAYQVLPEANQCSVHSRLDITQWTSVDKD